MTLLLKDIDLDQFPAISLEHGKDGEREWWEWSNRQRGGERKAIIIQRANQSLPFHIYFFQGERVRTLTLSLTKAEKERGVMAKTFGTGTIDGAIKTLTKLGIVVNVLASERG